MFATKISGRLQQNFNSPTLVYGFSFLLLPKPHYHEKTPIFPSINPEEAPRLWERMKVASGGKAQPELLSTHPSNQKRIDNLKKWIPEARKRADEIKRGSIESNP